MDKLVLLLAFLKSSILHSRVSFPPAFDIKVLLLKMNRHSQTKSKSLGKSETTSLRK